MNFTQLQAYLKAYLETNDTNVIDQIPNFMTLALARISAELRGVVAEVSVDLLPEPTQPQPAGFMGAVLLIHDGMISTYVTPADFAGLTNEEGAYYTLLAGQISAYPEPTSTTLLTLTYYQATGDNMSASLPHLLLHCAAAEAELFQGNLQDAAQEIQLYQNDMGSANGWDIQSGPISLGGGLRVAGTTAGPTNTPGTGYVKGPVTSVDGYIPLWDGPTGKLLEGGIPANTFATQASLGTAASANVTTSPTDTTAGRVTKVGDFGIGSISSMPSISALNSTQNAAGLYFITAGATGTPPTGAQVNATVFVERYSSTIIKQTWTDVAGGSAIVPRTWVRTSYAVDTWGAWVEVATSANSLGQGQTWQNVTGSRALGTTYTNSTGRPIMVIIGCGSGSGTSSFNLIVQGVVVDFAFPITTDQRSVVGIVPNGATYSVNSASGSPSISRWAELR